MWMDGGSGHDQKTRPIIGERKSIGSNQENESSSKNVSVSASVHVAPTDPKSVSVLVNE